MRAEETIHQFNRPLLFYTLSTFIPWTFWFIAGYVSQITPHQDKQLLIASILAFVGLLAPLVVVYTLTAQHTDLKKDILTRFFNFKDIKPIYYLLTFLIMPVSIMIAQAISLLFGYSSDQFTITGNFTFTSGIFPVWFLLIIAPIIEELAWHSYGTDCLRNRFNLFNVCLIFGLFWGVWHVPLSTIRDYYQSNVVNDGLIYGLNFLVSIFPFVILMNWLYYKTNRNILIATVFHITAGLFNELFTPHPDSKIIQTMLLTILAAIVVVKDKELFFKRE